MFERFRRPWVVLLLGLSAPLAAAQRVDLDYRVRFLPESDDPQFRKSALASSFVATLELARQGKIALRQDATIESDEVVQVSL